MIMDTILENGKFYWIKVKDFAQARGPKNTHAFRKKHGFGKVGRLRAKKDVGIGVKVTYNREYMLFYDITKSRKRMKTISKARWICHE